MKRIFCLSAICLLAAAPLLPAQDAATAAAAASKQEAEENYNTLKGHVDDLIAAQTDLQKKILALEKDVADLRAELNKSSPNYASADDLKALTQAVQELDKKREADKKLILEEMEKIGKSMSGTAPAHTNKPRVDAGGSATGGDETGYYYTIKKDDSLSLIAQAFREQGLKVTTQQILDANPNLNPNKLVVGKKIFIPAPKGSVLKPKS